MKNFFLTTCIAVSVFTVPALALGQKTPTTTTGTAKAPAPDLQNALSLGYGFKTKTIEIGYFLQYDKYLYNARVGFGATGASALGESKPGGSNYGTTKLGEGTNTLSIDIGGTYQVLSFNDTTTSYIALGITASVVMDRDHVNYQDRRFSEGGYHIKGDTELTFGIGGQVAVRHENFLLYSGYNTAKGVELGLGYFIRLR